MNDRYRARISPGDWSRMVDFAKRAGQSPPRPPSNRRGLWAGAPQSVFLAVLNEQLDADGTAQAKLWGYYPDDEEDRAAADAERVCTVRGWLLQEGTHLPAGSRVVVMIIGPAAYVVASRECPEEE